MTNRKEILKAREEIKEGAWKNERKEMGIKEIIYRMETQYHALKKILERDPDNEIARGAFYQVRDDLHLLLNRVD